MEPFRIPSNQRYMVAANGLSYLAAERFTVIVAAMGTPHWHMMCQIQFHRRIGSIFVQFPYFKESQGILSSATFEEAGGGQSEIQFERGGRATSHLVKYHHPPDGRVHFSQDNKVNSEIRRQSFPLSQSGLLWEMHAFDLSGYEVVTKDRIRSRRAYLPQLFKHGLPNSLVIRGEWQEKTEVASSLIDADGPFVTVRRPRDGRTMKALLLGQPEGHPLTEHLLVLNVGVPPAVEVDRPTMIFLGGWDSPLRADTKPGHRCLSFMYPVDRFEELVRSVGTVDRG